MGYVEDIKKINKMAKELISHGMASSFDEAVQKATKMLGEGASVTHSRDFESSKAVQQQQPMPQKQEQPQQPKQQQCGRDERTGMTWQQAMAKNNEYVVRMLKDFQKHLQDNHSRVGQIESAMQDLKRKQAKLGDMMVVPKGSEEINIEVDEQPRGMPQQEPVQQQQQQQSQQQPKESHPKQGGYNSEDVSVEKVFYFGNKK
tara:strand:- start:3568 stop:4173 length:606 start_codon:yes stop_codon:yes gene_type:complete